MNWVRKDVLGWRGDRNTCNIGNGSYKDVINS